MDNLFDDFGFDFLNETPTEKNESGRLYDSESLMDFIRVDAIYDGESLMDSIRVDAIYDRESLMDSIRVDDNHSSLALGGPMSEVYNIINDAALEHIFNGVWDNPDLDDLLGTDIDTFLYRHAFIDNTRATAPGGGGGMAFYVTPLSAKFVRSLVICWSGFNNNNNNNFSSI